MALEIDVLAPDFIAIDDANERITLSNYKGKWIVLYFYPKDNTSGCTKEACAFRDNMERITSLGAVVLGVSPDGIASHTKFKEKYNLNFSLIVDTEKEVCNLYDIMGEKSMCGRKYFGVIRTTYIINPDRKIAYVFNKVKVDGHVDKVIEKLYELMG